MSTELARPASMVGLQLAIDLENAGALTPTSLTLDDPTMPYERAEALAVFLGRMGRAVRWWCADLWLFGEGVYGEESAQLMDAFGLTEETLKSWVYVAERVPRSRRRSSLPFGCHRAVASLEPRAQERWLKRAEKEGWRTRDLEAAIRAEKAEQRGEQQQFEGTQEPVPADPDTIREAAHAVIRDARSADVPGFTLVPDEDIVRLRAALGLE